MAQLIRLRMRPTVTGANRRHDAAAQPDRTTTTQQARLTRGDHQAVKFCRHRKQAE
jgi:hypothetical protein